MSCDNIDIVKLSKYIAMKITHTFHDLAVTVSVAISRRDECYSCVIVIP